MIVMEGTPERFTVVDNKTLEPGLMSPEALGVYVYLLSKPPAWEVHPRQLQKAFDIGRNKVYRIINEWIAAGVCEREQVRSASGKHDAIRYTMFRTPRPQNRDTVVSPRPQKRDTDKRDTDNRDALVKTDLEQVLNKKQVPIDIAHFDEFWALYPRRVGKAKAEQSWAKLDASSRTEVLAHLPGRIATDQQWQQPQFIPYPATFLNGQQWHDEYLKIGDSSSGRKLNNIELAKLTIAAQQRAGSGTKLF